MENISRLKFEIRKNREITLYPYLSDHRLEGRSVLPAAEILIVLAGAVKESLPQAAIGSLKNAFFPHFLTVPEKARCIAVAIDIQAAAGAVSAVLHTSVQSGKTGISRSVEHGRVTFAVNSGDISPANPFPSPEKLKGECINVPAAVIYRELVPFGAAYQNITGDITISGEGAVAYLAGGAGEADDGLLGSPFTFDALLHAACVWGQRFGGVVAFPVGFAARNIYKKTKKGTAYLGRVLPVESNQKEFVFDAWIFDMQGAVCEVIEGIRMRDLTKGRMKPPGWIIAMG